MKSPSFFAVLFLLEASVFSGWSGAQMTGGEDSSGSGNCEDDADFCNCIPPSDPPVLPSLKESEITALIQCHHTCIDKV